MNLKPVDFKAVAAKGCYVYAYLLEHDLTPYYVGFASNHTRPFERHTCTLPSYNALTVVLRSGLSEKEAFAWESYYIARFGRKDLNNGLLLNQTDGGEGCLGRICDEGTRCAIQETLAARLAGKYGFSVQEWLGFERAMRQRMPRYKKTAESFGYSLKEWMSFTKGEKISIIKNQPKAKANAAKKSVAHNARQQELSAAKWGVPVEIYKSLDSKQSRAMKAAVRQKKVNAMDYLVSKGWAA